MEEESLRSDSNMNYSLVGKLLYLVLELVLPSEGGRQAIGVDTSKEHFLASIFNCFLSILCLVFRFVDLVDQLE